MTELESLSLFVAMNHLIRHAYTEGIESLTEMERKVVFCCPSFDSDYHRKYRERLKSKPAIAGQH